MDPDMIEKENARLREQVTELQAAMTRMVEERRENDLRLQVKAFHVRFGQPIGGSAPKVMDDARVRCRLLLGAEEFCEQLSACFRFNPAIEHALMDEIRYARIRVDLPAWIDGLGDSNYIAAGTALELGVDMKPIQLAIQASNMAKIPNGLGKPLKPDGWQPPDIEKLLRKQGWCGQ